MPAGVGVRCLLEVSAAANDQDVHLATIVADNGDFSQVCKATGISPAVRQHSEMIHCIGEMNQTFRMAGGIEHVGELDNQGS